MSAYTPGPWLFVQGGTGDFPIWSVRIGTRGLITLPATAGMETMDADARLIAAAPDLLEALKLCLPYVRAAMESVGGMDEYRAESAADAAIAKAEGKE